MATNTQLLDKLKALGQTGAIDYIKKNAEVIKGNPDLQKAIASTYMEAFGRPVVAEGTMDGGTPVGITPTPTPVVTAPSTTTPSQTIPQTANAWSDGGYQYSDAIKFTPDQKIGSGIYYNSKGTTDEEKFGLTSVQKADYTKYLQTIKNSGLPVVEVNKRGADYLKQLQSDNKNSISYGKSYGSDPANVPTDPTKQKGSIDSLVDLNGNGIPDTQEGFGLTPETVSQFKTFNENPWGGKYNFDTTNFTDLEKSFATYSEDLLKYETEQKRKAAESAALVTNENTKRIIDLNNQQIGSIQGLLEERLNQNKEQYKDAVGSVYRQFGGQVKQFQRIIGSDGRAVDDQTALALLGDTGVGAMSKIVDLKNQLVNDYISQKDKAIKDIYTLQKEKVISTNEAATAVQAIRDQAELDVIDMTKTFYKQMFGITEATNTRNEEQQNAIRGAVSSYLGALGLTPLQQNALINNYVKQGFSVNDALTKLSDDIRNQAAPVMAYINENNKDAAAAAKAAFEKELALKIQPILAKGEVDLQLQNDKQEFDKEQNALDRKFKVAGSTVGKGTKQLTYAQKVAMAGALTKNGEGTFPENMTEGQALEIISAASALDKDAGNTVATQKLQRYGISLETPGGFIEGLRSAAQ